MVFPDQPLASVFDIQRHENGGYSVSTHGTKHDNAAALRALKLLTAARSVPQPTITQPWFIGMIMIIIHDVSVASIVQWAESRPGGFDSLADTRSLPLLACDLCDAITDFLTDDQRLALTAAFQYLRVGETTEADRWISCFAQRVGRPYPTHVSQQEVAIERLLWIALNRATNLSGYALDFTLGVAEQAGISLGYMSSAVERMVHQRDESTD